jgi:DNA-binding MarR family transcriptional regulator
MARDDLGMLTARLTARIVEAEKPLLQAEGLSMWQYVTLSELARRPVSTQLALAEAIGYDKSRLVGLLDELEQGGLITRVPDPEDRRARRVALSTHGRDVHARAQRRIRAMESALLAVLEPGQREDLRAILATLVHEEAVG